MNPKVGTIPCSWKRWGGVLSESCVLLEKRKILLKNCYVVLQ